MERSDIDYQEIALAQSREIEGYRIKIAELQREKKTTTVDLTRLISWVEHHYLFCIVILLAISYALSSIIEFYGTTLGGNDGRQRRREGWW